AGDGIRVDLVTGVQTCALPILVAGRELAGDTVVDHFVIQNVHPQLPAAIKGRVKVDAVEAVGIIETKEVASAIYAGDAAVKAARSEERRGGKEGRSRGEAWRHN